MKRLIQLCLLTAGLTLTAGTVQANSMPIYMPHDSGLGKSQDGNDTGDNLALGSVSVAPEPETYLLFIIGGALMLFYSRRTVGTRTREF